MAFSSTKKSKSSGIRILWLPGQKSHSKDRFRTTKKHINYSGHLKKGKMWTLGGSKAQTGLTDLPLSDLKGGYNHPPSSSLSLVATCSLAAQSECALSTDCSSAIASETVTIHSTSTLLTTNSPPNLRPTFSLSEITTSTPIIMTPTNVITTAEIQNFPNIMDLDDFPKVPTETEETALVVKRSAGTTVTMAQGEQKTPQKIKYRNHNNNLEDINSIESISSSSSIQGNAIDFDWIDEMVEQRKYNEMMHKNKQKAAKKGLDSSLQPEADQLDVQLHSSNSNEKATNNSSKGTDGDDEMVVKCLYYSLMCCDCRIS